jgi:hypothetical protein
VLSFISQPLFNCNPTASHSEYVMMKMSTLPAPTDPKKCSKCIGGIIFLFLLRAIMDVMVIGTTTLADCANHASRRYICYAFKCGIPFGEFRNLMHHQQATRYRNYSNEIIWQQCKNARYTLQNEVLPPYNQVGSRVSRREQLKQVLSGLWKAKWICFECYQFQVGEVKAPQCEPSSCWMDAPSFMGSFFIMYRRRTAECVWKHSDSFWIR